MDASTVSFQTSTGPPVVVTVRGDLDLATSRMLVDHVVALGAGDVVLDLREVEFIDASGLGALVAVRRHLRGLGSAVQVVPSRRVGLTLALGRLDTAFAPPTAA